MKILITGGAGFIGSNLCEHFVGKGHDVTCLDNLSTGFLHNIEPLKAAPNFRFIQGDIRHPRPGHLPRGGEGVRRRAPRGGAGLRAP